MLTNHKAVEEGAENLKRVRHLFETHPGITRTEIASMLGLSPTAVSRHASALRAEWGAQPLPTARSRKSYRNGASDDTE